MSKEILDLLKELLWEMVHFPEVYGLSDKGKLAVDKIYDEVKDL